MPHRCSHAFLDTYDEWFKSVVGGNWINSGNNAFQCCCGRIWKIVKPSPYTNYCCCWCVVNSAHIQYIDQLKWIATIATIINTTLIPESSSEIQSPIDCNIKPNFCTKAHNFLLNLNLTLEKVHITRAVSVNLIYI